MTGGSVDVRITRLADAGSVLGQLQRGRGEGFLAALEMPPAEAADLLWKCIVHDPRYDLQIDSRDLYYSTLAQEVGLEVERLRPQNCPTPAPDVDQRLVVGVLAELVAVGADGADAVLLDHVAHGDQWDDAIDEISQSPGDLYRQLPAVLDARFSEDDCVAIVHRWRYEVPWDRIDNLRPWVKRAIGFKTVMQRTQPEGSRSGPGDIDRTLHSLRRFVRMAAAGNPSILMTMWAPVEYSTPMGEELQALGEAFVGRHVVPRYRGYMQSQARRLLGVAGGGHGKRGSGGRAELINEFGYDTKYAMHCARLGFQCLELLSTGKLELPIQGEPAEWLRSVRYGKIDFDEWWKRSLELDAQLEAIGDDESIRPTPDREKIDEWCINAHHRTWAGGQG